MANFLLAAAIEGQVSIAPKAVTVYRLAYSTTYGLASGALLGINGMIAGDDVAPMISFAGDPAARATAVRGGFGLPMTTRDVDNYNAAIDTMTGAAEGEFHARRISEIGIDSI